MATRFAPFLLFSENRKTPALITYLGKVLPAAVFGMLMIYCLKDINFTGQTHGIPELVSIGATAAVHKWKGQMLLSIAAGTALYMLLIHFL
jgi:branched-subunit amino acid transport protein AzlD